MTAKIPSELINNNLKLVSLPAIIEKINRTLNDPASTSSDIAHYISQDSTLSARLLKFVNSPFYNFPSKIDSISMAVTILGTKQLRDLVFVTTIVNRFKPAKQTRFDIETFWCHSITTGLAARVIASEQKNLNSERLFLCGVLHDIGKMIMSLLLPEDMARLQNTLLSKHVNLDDIEKQIFGYSHGDWAKALFENWCFPDSISEPILHHHNPEQCNEYTVDCSVLHIANVIANNIQAPISKDDDTILKPFALKAVGINHNDIETFYEQVYLLLDDVLKSLYYDVAA